MNGQIHMIEQNYNFEYEFGDKYQDKNELRDRS